MPIQLWGLTRADALEIEQDHSLARLTINSLRFNKEFGDALAGKNGLAELREAKSVWSLLHDAAVADDIDAGAVSQQEGDHYPANGRYSGR